MAEVYDVSCINAITDLDKHVDFISRFENKKYPDWKNNYFIWFYGDKFYHDFLLWNLAFYQNWTGLKENCVLCDSRTWIVCKMLKYGRNDVQLLQETVLKGTKLHVIWMKCFLNKTFQGLVPILPHIPILYTDMVFNNEIMW